MLRSGTLGLVALVALIMVVTPVAGATQVRGDRTSVGPFLGVLTITSGCALSAANAPISQSGDTFTLTGELNGSLIVLCPDATVDGAGHVLNYSTQPGGNPGVAVTVNATQGVTIENVVFLNETLGVEANGSSGLTLQGNTIPNATSSAITVGNSERVTIEDNRLTGAASNAVYLDNVSGGTVAGNQGNGSVYGIEAAHSSTLSISGNNDSFGTYGVSLVYANGTNVSGNQAFRDEYPLLAEDSSNDSFFENVANNNTYAGLYFYEDTSVTATANIVANSSTDASYIDASAYVTERGNDGRHALGGFESDASSHLVYVDNNASFDDDGFYADGGTANTFTGNAALGVDGEAFQLDYTSDSRVVDNHAEGSEYGLYVEYDYRTVASGNDFANATTDAVYSDYESSNLTLLNNDLANSTEYGVYVYYPAGAITASGNDIAGAGYVGVEVYYTYGPVDLTGNDIRTADDYAVYAEETYGTVTVNGNDLADSGGYAAVEVDDAYGTTQITGNNLSDAIGYGVYLEYAYGATNVSGNTITNASDTAVYAFETYGGLWIDNNNVSRSADGIYVEEAYGQTNISANVAVGTGTAIDVYEPYGATEILDNDATRSLDYGIAVDDSYEYGVVETLGNNASGSKGYSLYYYDVEYTANPIVENDFSNSAYVTVVDSYYLQVVGNDLLNVSAIDLTGNTFAAFDHNDINTTAFDGSGSTMDTGIPSSWNAPYPIGGNYWTGYAGPDLDSGPAQNVPGSDGIGDSPQPIPLESGSFDAYPLIHRWASDPSTLTFSETGLPASTEWSVVVTFGGYGSGSLTGEGSGSAPISISVPYGTATPFSYEVAYLGGFTASPSSGTGVTSPGTLTTRIAFSPFGETTSFEVADLSAGTSWSVSVNGHIYPSTSVWDNVSLPNGTYAWSATTSGAPEASGSVTVHGASQTVTVEFHFPTYPVIFTETGLSSGTSWSVTFDGVTESGTGGAITFFAVNGTHAFTVSSTGRTATPASGTVTTSGSATTQAVDFGSSSTSVSSTSSTNLALYGLAALAVVLGILAAIGWTRSGGRKSGGGGTSSPTTPWSGPTPPSGAPASPPATPPGGASPPSSPPPP